MENKAIIEQINNIIHQPIENISRNDSVVLAVLHRDMSCLYDDYMKNASESEQNYSLSREEGYLNERKTKSQGDSDRQAKLIAEQANWDYRVYRAKAQWYKAKMDSLNTIIMTVNAKNKALDSLW